MRLSKIKALQICKELWEWMLVQPLEGMYKDQWPGWQKYGYMMVYCPCCEYFEQKRRDDPCAQICLLKWRNGNCIRGEYGDWQKATGIRDIERAKSAIESILKLIDDAMDKNKSRRRMMI